MPEWLWFVGALVIFPLSRALIYKAVARWRS